MEAPTALIADDEPLLRERLAAQLAVAWPELRVVAQARNGRDAVELFEQLRPRIAFLDVHMPGVNGIEAARSIGRRAELVFVTAYETYAVEAFRQGAVDYLVKPIEEDRLRDTVQRLRQRLVRPDDLLARPDLSALFDRMATRLREGVREGGLAAPAHLQWIRASVGTAVRLIPVDQVIYLKADAKYTLVVWSGGEALIRKTIREMAEQLDPARFAQIHRSAIVNLNEVSQFSHGPGDAGEVHLKGRTERLSVSRSCIHLFRQM